MNCTDPPIDLEKKICNWLSRKDITNNELCYNIISRLLHIRFHIDCFRIWSREPKERQVSTTTTNTRPITWLVVAWITPIGRVTIQAIAKANSIPHQGSWTVSFHTNDIRSDSAMLPNNKIKNHHSGTCLYLCISFAWMSNFAFLIAALLCFHMSLEKWKRIILTLRTQILTFFLIKFSLLTTLTII